MSEVFYTSIAGINFYANENDVGPITGYSNPNPVEKDPEAIGLYLKDGRLIGFIPANRKQEFSEFAKDLDSENQCLFSGNIKKVVKRSDKYFVGNIALVKSDSLEDLRKTLEKNYSTDLDLYGGKNPKVKE